MAEFQINHSNYKQLIVKNQIDEKLKEKSKHYTNIIQ